jgi:hypothetical protein
MRTALNGIIFLLLGSLPGAMAQAQPITSDGSLNTVVTQSGNTFAISNGSTVGSNLFHSFQTFSIPTGGSAIFDLSTHPNIQTIFNRVTGNTSSQIDGLIQTLNSPLVQSASSCSTITASCLEQTLRCRLVAHSLQQLLAASNSQTVTHLAQRHSYAVSTASAGRSDRLAA